MNRRLNPQIRVLLADDHTLVRGGLRALLEQLDGVTVIAEAGDGMEAVRLAATHRPDVAVLDISMPRMGGLEATARITRQFPAIRVLLLSMHSREEHVAEALTAGASGFLVKAGDPRELELSLRALVRGESYWSPPVANHLVAARRFGGLQRARRLTARQREILHLIGDGLTTKQIAAELDLSVKTVETHRTQLMQRLGVRDLATLIRTSIQLGLLTAE